MRGVWVNLCCGDLPYAWKNLRLFVLWLADANRPCICPALVRPTEEQLAEARRVWGDA